MRPAEPHLGDMYGEPLPPMRPLRMPRHRHPGWIERGVHLFLAYLGIGALVVIALAYVVLLFTFFTVKPSLAAETLRVPVACKALAQRYGVGERVTHAEAAGLVAELDKHWYWPGVRQCRAAVKRDLKL